ncbi:hypothetical protein SDC9_127426 [bioreactor metagenome]|uniref:Uncharacterized protein n=1 Tax=bioreactor metagenome TaxID=1076179 RepID=A0A645CU10_9ZZZZ
MITLYTFMLTNLKLFTSKRPKSVSFISGITGNAKKDNVMDGS